jgi:hypothetical protein
MEWAFNNPDESDIRVVITTETAADYRARKQGEPAGPHSKPAVRRTGEAQSPSADPVTPRSKQQPAFEELYGHKVILKSYSDFFKAAVDWNKSAEGPRAGATRKRGREEPEVAVLFLSDEQQFGTAKLMIRFMYTQQLDAGIDRCEVLRLMQLGDQFSVPKLRVACMLGLAATPLVTWSALERQCLCSCWACVAIDSMGAGELAAAAKALETTFAAHFVELEHALADESNWPLLCSLPQPVLLQILGNNDLVIRSENTVLVAALSWLRTAGMDAAEAVRKQVLRKVRLLHLSPWFLAWFMFDAPEAHALLPPGALAALVRYAIHASAESQAQILDGSEFLELCSTAREGMQPGLTAMLKLDVEGQALSDAVVKCLVQGATAAGIDVGDTVWEGEARFFNGVFWKPRLDVSMFEGEAAVFAAVTASLKIGEEVVGFDVGDGVLMYPSHYQLLTPARVVDVAHADAMVLGVGWSGETLFSASRIDEVEALVTKWSLAGQLRLRFTILT